MCAGIVIDDGTGGGAPVSQGASVPPGSSDLDLLNAAGDTFTQNDSGLICAINNYPANGLQNCLNAAHGLYYYWSYWEGDPTTNTWTYANVGTAEHTVTAGQSYVEGWRYQDPGPDSPDATKPSVTPAAAFAQACSGGSRRHPPSGGGTGAGGDRAAPVTHHDGRAGDLAATSATRTGSSEPAPAATPARPHPTRPRPSLRQRRAETRSARNGDPIPVHDDTAKHPDDGLDVRADTPAISPWPSAGIRRSGGDPVPADPAGRSFDLG